MVGVVLESGECCQPSLLMSMMELGSRVLAGPAETRSFLHNLAVDPHLPSIILPAKVRSPDRRKPRGESN